VPRAWGSGQLHGGKECVGGAHVAGEEARKLSVVGVSLRSRGSCTWPSDPWTHLLSPTSILEALFLMRVI